jgi:hypothetical protein
MSKVNHIMFMMKLVICLLDAKEDVSIVRIGILNNVLQNANQIGINMILIVYLEITKYSLASQRINAMV